MLRAYSNMNLLKHLQSQVNILSLKFYGTIENTYIQISEELADI